MFNVLKLLTLNYIFSILRDVGYFPYKRSPTSSSAKANAPITCFYTSPTFPPNHAGGGNQRVYVRFGIYDVDMEDPERKRTPKKSDLVYKEIARSRVIDYNYDADPYAPSAASGRNVSIFITLLLATLKVLV